MAVDFKTFSKIVPHVIRVNKAILLRGRHGIGKSEVVYQTAANMKSILPDRFKAPLPVVERRASQLTEGDLVGLPSIDGNSTKWNAPDWFKMACDMPVVLFLDEVDRATTEVRQGIFELTDSRKLNGWHLHKDTIIFAAVNGGTHASQYQVGEMDPAELDRWTVFDVEPSVEDFLDWGKDNLNPVIWDFINTNRVHLEHKGDFEPNKVYPSRRSWHRLNDCLEQGKILADVENKSNLPLIYELAHAFIGMEGAVALRDFCNTYQNQVTVEDLLVEGKFDKVKKWGINDYVSLIDKASASGILKEKFTPQVLANAARLFITMPSEAGMKFWQNIGSQNVQNVVLMNTAKYRGKTVNEHLVSIMTGKDAKTTAAA
jgi:hypothetical protein